MTRTPRQLKSDLKFKRDSWHVHTISCTQNPEPCLAPVQSHSPRLRAAVAPTSADSHICSVLGRLAPDRNIRLTHREYSHLCNHLDLRLVLSVHVSRLLVVELSGPVIDRWPTGGRLASDCCPWWIDCCNGNQDVGSGGGDGDVCRRR